MAWALSASSTDSRAWGTRLLGGPVSYFPIRHHSPACAWHLDRWIDQHRPGLVLIEGPSNFDGFRDLLANPETVPPIALYSYCNLASAPERDTTAPSSSAPGSVGNTLPFVSRRGAYYPMSAYSPEWVALQAAKRVGAEV